MLIEKNNAMHIKPRRGDILIEKHKAMPLKPRRGDILIITAGFYLGASFHVHWTFKLRCMQKMNSGGIN
jgi:hypothetical protein